MAHDVGVNDICATPRIQIAQPPDTKATSQDSTLQGTRIRCANTRTILSTESQKMKGGAGELEGGGGGGVLDSVF